jgi:hypothetical protein
LVRVLSSSVCTESRTAQQEQDDKRNGRLNPSEYTPLEMAKRMLETPPPPERQEAKERRRKRRKYAGESLKTQPTT